jgi:hypothetical protein
MTNSLFDILLDSKNKDNMVLYNENGEAEEFSQVGIIKDDKTEQVFAILHPIKLKGDEVVVFELLDDEYETIKFVGDEAVANKVLDKYKKLLETT